MIHAWIQELVQGVQVHLPENSSDNVVFSPQLILQRVSNGYSKENYYFLRFPRGSNFFKGGGGGQLFPEVGGGGGPNANFYINSYNL